MTDPAAAERPELTEQQRLGLRVSCDYHGSAVGEPCSPALPVCSPRIVEGMHLPAPPPSEAPPTTESAPAALPVCPNCTAPMDDHRGEYLLCPHVVASSVPPPVKPMAGETVRIGNPTERIRYDADTGAFVAKLEFISQGETLQEAQAAVHEAAQMWARHSHRKSDWGLPVEAPAPSAPAAPRGITITATSVTMSRAEWAKLCALLPHQEIPGGMHGGGVPADRAANAAPGGEVGEVLAYFDWVLSTLHPEWPHHAQVTQHRTAVTRLADDNARLMNELAKCADGESHWTPSKDGEAGRFLAFVACQRDDTDRAICDAFYRAFARLEEQLDATQRRLQATEDARQRVCFARDRFAEQLEATIQRDNIEAQRISTIADEAFGPFPVQTSDENLTAIERGIFGLRQRIGQLEAEKVAVADVASEGDVEDLLDALENLSADPKDGETWGARYQTAGAMHAACQEERIRRTLAEDDAERWHRLFDEGATLTAQIAAERDRLAAEVERLTAEQVRERASALRGFEAARIEIDTLRAKLTAVEKDRRDLDADVRAAHGMRAELEMLRTEVERMQGAPPVASVEGTVTRVHDDLTVCVEVELNARISHCPFAEGQRVDVRKVEGGNG